MTSPLRPDPVDLERTGDCRLRLEGPSLAAHVDTRGERGQQATRWHEVSVWEADSIGPGAVCLEVVYRSRWEGERDHHYAEVVPAASLRDRLVGYDPTEHAVGFPPRDDYAARQRRLERDLRAAWEHAVSDVLELMDVWELGRGPDAPPADSEEVRP